MVFVSLNPSGEVPTDYANFHSPEGKHYDDRLKSLIQENDLGTLTGGYMTDIIPDVVEPDSANVTPETADIDRFLEQLSFPGESEYHIICFTGKTFEALRSYFDADAQQEPNSIELFDESVDGKTLHVYRVWFYGLYGVYQDKVAELEAQLAYLNDEIVSYTLLETPHTERTVKSRDAIDSEERIIGVMAEAPLGLLKILKEPRKSTNQTDIVSYRP